MEFPTFDIINLNSENISKDLFHADRFAGYVKNNPHVGPLHRHTFYHLVYFSSGNGKQILDFETYPIQKGIIYFMRPGQVHQWKLENEVDGYIINFSSTFFDQNLISSRLLDQFTFYSRLSSEQVLQLEEDDQHTVTEIFEKILSETEKILPEKLRSLLIISHLIELLVVSERSISSASPTAFNRNNHNSLVIKKFLHLIDLHFKEFRLPKDYAELLNITPHYLNTLCREQIQSQAGELIRKRVILEAKRLLINFSVSVADISFELNFSDTSYFVKFFKKHTGLTPEVFRKQYYEIT